MKNQSLPAQLPLPLPLDPDVSLESFFPGGNERALGLVRQLLEDCGESIRWLCCHGPAAAGKTHLLQAAAAAWRERGHDAAYLGLARTRGKIPESAGGMHEGALYCLDDVDAVAGDVIAERALFVLLNELRQRKARVLLACKLPPRELRLGLPDLRSRLCWGAQAVLRPLGDEALYGLVVFQAGLLGLSLPPAVANYLLSRLPRRSDAIISSMRQLSQYSLASGRRLTVPMVRKSLRL